VWAESRSPPGGGKTCWRRSNIALELPVDHSAETGKSREAGSAVPDMMTAKELEALLRIDVKTIYSYVQRGLIPYVRIQSNVRFVKQEISDWIKTNSYAPKDIGERKKERRRSSPRSPLQRPGWITPR
jgi:excisionase family DNA binding protein